jgi:cytochrome P450
VEEAGDRLTADELRAMVTVLIFGGQDTTQCQLACAAATFAAHPDAWKRLAETPSLAASAAEEVLRYEPAGSGSPRLALEDLEHKGLAIPAGSVALPSGPAANRDPEVYADPDRFDVERVHPRPMLTFGGGVHYCLGAHLARLELTEALRVITARMPNARLAGPVPWKAISGITGPLSVPLEFDAL